ncbi:hypothetical protein EB001_16690 [bacterium]|nr:hypothetical protein [bacterium]
MQKSMNVNGWIGSLPKIRKFRTWNVFYNGESRGCVRADNLTQAMGYLSMEKFPEREKIRLEYVGYTYPRY